jgi:hypothetical protein
VDVAARRSPCVAAGGSRKKPCVAAGGSRDVAARRSPRVGRRVCPPPVDGEWGKKWGGDGVETRGGWGFVRLD